MKQILITYFLLSIASLLYSQDFTSAVVANEKLVKDFVEKNNIPGLSIAVCVDGKIIWSAAFGYSNIELKMPATPETKFRIASLSKSLTGTAIAKLVDKGLINLNDPISKYLTDIPPAWDSITIYQICEHSSGIGHYIDDEDGNDTTYYETTNEALQVFKSRPLVSEPGERRSYSSYAYTVLAAVIEKVTGKDFLTFMEEEIFNPLNMKNTVPDMKRLIIPQRSGLYSYGKNNEIVKAQYVDNSSRWAGTGYLSTAEDLALFGDVHTNSSFLSKEMLDLIYYSPRRFSNGNIASETLAWGPRKGWEGRQMLWNNGTTPGCTGGLLVFPEQKLTISILSNVNGAPLDRGELQFIALRFIAAIEGNEVEEISEKEIGNYEFDLKMGGRDFRSTMELLIDNNELSGYFEVEGLQKFAVGDAFNINGKTWIAGLGRKGGVFKLGILPVVIDLKAKEITGNIFRVDAEIEGEKVE